LIAYLVVLLTPAGNIGKNSNTSQFFITLDALPKLNGKHVVFGEIVSGFDILDLLEEIGSPLASEGVPTTSAVIADCGILDEVDISLEVTAAEPEPAERAGPEPEIGPEPEPESEPE
jgi:cyclophilin family peptidyl-prolyl cis-trans isomerase